MQNVRLKISALDYDRHTKTSELGSTTLALKDVKHLSEEKVTITNFLTQKKQVRSYYVPLIVYYPSDADPNKRKILFHTSTTNVMCFPRNSARS